MLDAGVGEELLGRAGELDGSLLDDVGPVRHLQRQGLDSLLPDEERRLTVAETLQRLAEKPPVVPPC